MLETFRDDHAISIPEVEFQIEQLNDFLSNINNSVFGSLRASDRKKLTDKLSELELEAIVTKGNLIKLKRWLSLEATEQENQGTNSLSSPQSVFLDFHSFLEFWKKKLEILEKGLSYYDLQNAPDSDRKQTKADYQNDLDTSKSPQQTQEQVTKFNKKHFKRMKLAVISETPEILAEGVPQDPVGTKHIINQPVLKTSQDDSAQTVEMKKASAIQKNILEILIPAEKFSQEDTEHVEISAISKKYQRTKNYLELAEVQDWEDSDSDQEGDLENVWSQMIDKQLRHFNVIANGVSGMGTHSKITSQTRYWTSLARTQTLEWHF